MSRTVSPGHQVDREGSRLLPGSFYGTVERQWRSDLVTMSVVSHGQGRRVPIHAHQHAFVTLLLRGGYDEEVEGRRIVYVPMSLVFHPMGLVHCDEVHAGGADFLTLELAPAFLGQRLRQRPGLRSVHDLSGGPAVWSMLRAFRDFVDGEPAGLVIEEPVAELVDALADTRGGLEASEPPWLHAVEGALEERYKEPLSLAALAREARVHPVHLSRVFRRWRGRSLRTTVHRLRVREACRLMQEGLSLAQTALATGFADQSHLTNVFRRVTGSTPGALRRFLAGEFRSRKGVTPRVTRRS